MKRCLPFVLVLFAGLPAVAQQPAVEQPTPALRFTVMNERGARSGTSREAVLKTVSMDDAQLRAWVRDEAAKTELRAAEFFMDGYVAVISRDATGLLFSIRDPEGVRSGRNSASLLKTRGMTAEQLKVWAAAPDAKAEERILVTQGPGAVRTTISSAAGVFSSLKGDELAAMQIDNLGEAGILKWVEDPKAAAESRFTYLYHLGHLEVIWHSMDGRLRYTISSEIGHRTSGNRESVKKTEKMDSKQLLTWATDPKGAAEQRSASLYQDGYVETISYGIPEVPPLPQ